MLVGWFGLVGLLVCWLVGWFGLVGLVGLLVGLVWLVWFGWFGWFGLRILGMGAARGILQAMVSATARADSDSLEDGVSVPCWGVPKLGRLRADSDAEF